MLAELIESHGYWVIFLGTLFEGETILLLGGIAAHRGYLLLWGVMLAAFSGSLACDQVFFFLGRRHGPAVLARRPGWCPSVKRVDDLLERYDVLLIVGFRFLYGIRTVTPFVLGMSSAVATSRFVVLNVIGAAIWAVGVGGAGYALGNAAEALLGRARHDEVALFGIVAVLGAIAWMIHRARSRRDRSLASSAAPPIERTARVLGTFDPSEER